MREYALSSCLRYPDYEYRGYREAVANYYGLDPDKVVPLNGAAEALTLVVTALKPSVLISIEPTFGDHPFMARGLGVPWVAVPLTPNEDEYELDPSVVYDLPQGVRRGSLVILSNPNNPTGSLARPKVLLEISELLEEGFLLVDEAFIDLSPAEGYSLLGRSPSNVVVVRSLTKPLAVPGLRAGFAYTTDKRVATRLEAARQPWNVNALAALVTTTALGACRREVVAHLREARRVVEEEAGRVKKNLGALGLRVYETKAPYVLVHHPQARHPGLQVELNKRGVHVREAGYFKYLTPYHSRVSIKRREENELLLRVFEEVFRGPRAVWSGEQPS